MSHYQPRSESVSHPQREEGMKPPGRQGKRHELEWYWRKRQGQRFIETIPPKHVSFRSVGTASDPFVIGRNQIKPFLVKKYSPRNLQPYIRR